MSTGAPERKVGLVQFNSELNIIGDGSKGQVAVAGDKLYDFEFLLNNGIQEGSGRMLKPIKETKAVLQ